jgi:hypothetical protein
MTDKDDGGHAFPADASTNLYSRGMTLRDYFAAKAIGPILTGARLPEETWGEHLPIMGRFAYAIADAMLKARTA